ncbi:MAG: hypothetical protein ABIJ34_01705 [archaeon]
MRRKEYKEALDKYKKKFRVVSEDNGKGGDKYKIQHSMLSKRGEFWCDGQYFEGSYGCHGWQTQYFDTKAKAIEKINNVKQSLTYKIKIEEY